MTNHFCKLILTTTFLLALTFKVNATLINYDFSATYRDGSTAIGDFNYDTDSGLFSNILIEFTSGTRWDDQIFTLNHFDNYRALVLLDVADGPDYDTDTVFHIILQDGGTWGELAPASVYSDVAECDKNHCPARRNLDVAPETSLIGTVIGVPEPSTLAIFAMGLFVLLSRKLQK